MFKNLILTSLFVFGSQGLTLQLPAAQAEYVYQQEVPKNALLPLTSEKRLQELSCQATEASHYLLQGVSSYKWPFGKALYEALESSDQETILIFSYGSLMNEDSAQRTLSAETLKTREPAIAFGVERVFDYDPTSSALGPPKDPHARAMLNVRPTGNPADFANGVVVEMPIADVKALCQREVGYDLIPVVITYWEDAKKDRYPTFQVAYTFSSPNEPRNGKIYTNSQILPRPEYLHLVRQGADTYGPEFRSFFEDSTYLADGKTPVQEEPR